MSEPYAGNPSNNPTSVTMPTDNDALDVASVRAALEGLMDKVEHALTGETEFDGTKVFQAVVEFAAGLLLGSGGIVGTNVPAPRELLFSFPVAANRRVRLYSRASAGTVYPSAGFEITLNAEWDVGPEQWKADLTSVPAYMLDVFDVSVGWASGSSEAGDPATVTIRTRATTSSPWAYDDWGAVLAFNPSNPSATSSGIVANTIYPRNIIKAWGHVRVTGAPGAPAVAFVSTAGMGFGLASVTIDSGTLLITLQKPMASTAYIVVPGMIGQQYIPNLSAIVSTTQFRIQFREPASGGGLDAVSPTAQNVECSFIVMGVQA